MILNIFLKKNQYFSRENLPPNGTPVGVNNRHCDRIIRATLGLVILTDTLVCSLGNNALT